MAITQVLTLMSSVFVPLVKCPEGSFSQDGKCTPCPAGTYQGQAGSSACIPCPRGRTTTITGAFSKTHCKFFLDHSEEGAFPTQKAAAQLLCFSTRDVWKHISLHARNYLTVAGCWIASIHTPQLLDSNRSLFPSCDHQTVVTTKLDFKNYWVILGWWWWGARLSTVGNHWVIKGHFLWRPGSSQAPTRLLPGSYQSPGQTPGQACYLQSQIHSSQLLSRVDSVTHVFTDKIKAQISEIT